MHTHTQECKALCPSDVRYPSDSERCRATHPTATYYSCPPTWGCGSTHPLPEHVLNRAQQVPVTCSRYLRNGRHDGDHRGLGECLKIVRWAQ